MSKNPRIVLITSGLRPVTDYFSKLPGTPVGIVNWNDNVPTAPTASSGKQLLAMLRSKLRGRQYPSLEHLCKHQKLQFADVYKRDSDKLQATLEDWKADMVITSSCSFVPMAALAGLSHGAINLHPSWLPDYRGAEPILWHIVDGLDTVAASVHRLSDQYDRGSILARQLASRPNGVSKAELTHITDINLGQTLLSQAIELLITDPHTAGESQPESSKTRYARRETAESLGSSILVNTLDADTVWDLIHYFGYCPPAWLTTSGWRSSTKWKPVRMHHLPDTKSDDAPTNWTTVESILKLQLRCQDATIDLRPWRLF